MIGLHGMNKESRPPVYKVDILILNKGWGGLYRVFMVEIQPGDIGMMGF